MRNIKILTAMLALCSTVFASDGRSFRPFDNREEEEAVARGRDTPRPPEGKLDEVTFVFEDGREETIFAELRVAPGETFVQEEMRNTTGVPTVILFQPPKIPAITGKTPEGDDLAIPVASPATLMAWDERRSRRRQLPQQLQSALRLLAIDDGKLSGRLDGRPDLTEPPTSRVGEDDHDATTSRGAGEGLVLVDIEDDEDSE